MDTFRHLLEELMEPAGPTKQGKCGPTYPDTAAFLEDWAIRVRQALATHQNIDLQDAWDEWDAAKPTRVGEGQYYESQP